MLKTQPFARAAVVVNEYGEVSIDHVLVEAPRKVNKLAMTALRLAAASKSQTVNEAILLDATAEAML